MKMDFEEVRRILDQRYPFIMVDRVLELEPDRRIVALKNVSGNEEIFSGHFPKRAIFPGAYIIEAVAQAAIILFSFGKMPLPDNVCIVGSSIKFRCSAPVVPGDQLITEANTIKLFSKAGIYSVTAKIQNRVVGKGEFTAAILEK